MVRVWNESPEYPDQGSKLFKDPNAVKNFKKLNIVRPEPRTPAGYFFKDFLGAPFKLIGGTLNNTRRGFKTFGWKLHSDLGIKAKDLNWVIYSDLGTDLYGHYYKEATLHKAYHDPKVYEERLKPPLEEFLRKMPDKDPTGQDLSPKDKFYLYNLTEDIHRQIGSHKKIDRISKQASNLTEFLKSKSIADMKEIQDELVEFAESINVSYFGRQEDETQVMNQALRIMGEEFKDLKNEDYKKALKLMAKYLENTHTYEKRNENTLKKYAILSKNLVLENPSLSTDQLFESYKKEEGMNDIKVFHTNAPENVYNSGIIFSTTGHEGSFTNRITKKRDTVKMPNYELRNEKFQISGHHIVKTGQPSYVVYLAQNNSNTETKIDIETAGIATNSESSFARGKYRGVHDNLTKGEKTIGPGDGAGLEVLSGKIDSRVKKNITVPKDNNPSDKKGSLKLITAARTNGNEAVNLNINGEIKGSTKLIGAVVTQAELNAHNGSFEAAVQAQLDSKKFVNRRHYQKYEKNEVGRATGLYVGSEYNINDNIVIGDSTKKGDVLAESEIAISELNSDRNQNGEAVTYEEGGETKYADLASYGYSSNRHQNFGNYGTRYKLNYNVSDFRSGGDADKNFKIKFSSFAGGGRSDQAAFRGTINVYLKDKNGNRIKDSQGKDIKHSKHVSIGFGQEVDLLPSLKFGPEVASIEVDMVNTGDSTPPYKVKIVENGSPKTTKSPTSDLKHEFVQGDTTEISNFIDNFKRDSDGPTPGTSEVANTAIDLFLQNSNTKKLSIVGKDSNGVRRAGTDKLNVLSVRIQNNETQKKTVADVIYLANSEFEKAVVVIPKEKVYGKFQYKVTKDQPGFLVSNDGQYIPFSSLSDDLLSKIATP